MAQYRLGRVYSKPLLGVVQDKVIGHRLNEAAAWQGHVEAEFRMFCDYHDGAGVAVDKRVAWRWAAVAAIHGHKRALFNLAVEMGNEKHSVLAQKLLLLSARQGLPRAQVLVGGGYLDGIGTESDLAKAHAWATSAAANGDAQGQLLLSYISEKYRGHALSTTTTGMGVRVDAVDLFDMTQDSAVVVPANKKLAQRVRTALRDRTKPSNAKLFAHSQEEIMDATWRFQLAAYSREMRHQRVANGETKCVFCPQAAKPSVPPASDEIRTATDPPVAATDEKKRVQLVNTLMDLPLLRASKSVSPSSSPSSSSSFSPFLIEPDASRADERDIEPETKVNVVCDADFMHEPLEWSRVPAGTRALIIRASKAYRLGIKKYDQWRLEYAPTFTDVPFFSSVVDKQRAGDIFELMLIAAVSGHVDARFCVGQMYCAGFGVLKDAAIGLRWLMAAAIEGHLSAAYRVARFYGVGDGGVQRDEKVHFHWLYRAASRGHPLAQCELGKLWRDGTVKCIDRNLVHAIHWLRCAARAGPNEAIEEELQKAKEELQKANEVTKEKLPKPVRKASRR